MFGRTHVKTAIRYGISAIALSLVLAETAQAQVTVTGNDTPTINSPVAPAQAAAGTPTGSTGTAAVTTSGNGISTVATGTIAGGQGGNGAGAGDNGGTGGVGLVYGGDGTITIGDNGTTATTLSGGQGGTAGGGGGTGGTGGAAITATGATATLRTLNIHEATITPGAGGAAGGGAAGSSSTTAIDIDSLTTLNLGNSSNATAVTNSINGDVTATGGQTTINFYDTNTITGLVSSGAGGRIDLGTTANTQINGALTITGGVAGGNTTTLANTIGATQSLSGQINKNAASTVSIGTGGQNTTLEPLQVGVGTSSGERIILVRNTPIAGTTLAGTIAARTATGDIAADTSYNTLVRTYSLGTGATAGFGGIDKFGTNINGTDVVLKVDVASAESIVGNRSLGQSSAFNTAANYGSNGTNTGVNGTQVDLVALNHAVQNLNTTSGVRKAADQLRPEVSGATNQAAQNAMNGVIAVTEARTQSLRTAAAGKTGIASGEAMRGLGIWAQGFGSTANQDSQDNYTGYDVQTYGLAIGGDVRVANNIRVGVSLAYANGNVDEKDNRSGNNLDIDSYLGNVYASFTGAPVYVDLNANIARHNYDSTRQVAVLGNTATASYDGLQYGAKAEAGYPIALGNKAVLTPVASLAYSHLNVDAYTETGAAGANLAVDSRSINSLRSGLGAKLGATVDAGNSWELKPSVKAVWAHEFIDDNLDTTARFAAGNNSFVTTGAKPASDALIVGVAVDVISASNVTGSLAYDAELKDGYVGHSGLVQVRYDF